MSVVILNMSKFSCREIMLLVIPVIYSDTLSIVDSQILTRQNRVDFLDCLLVITIVLKLMFFTRISAFTILLSILINVKWAKKFAS